MRQEIIIRLRPDSDKCHKKALKVAATVSGLESITVTGRDRDLLLVIGDGVDTGKLTKKLKKEVGEAEIVELRTLAAGSEALPGTSSSKDVVAAAVAQYSRSPYHWHHHPTPSRSLPGGGGRVAYSSAVASTGAAVRWPGEHGQARYYPRTTAAPSLSPCYDVYAASPMAGHGGYVDGSGSYAYARALARSHPANYSPMIARHDYHAAGRSREAVRRRRRGGGGGEPNCCSIL